MLPCCTLFRYTHAQKVFESKNRVDHRGGRRGYSECYTASASAYANTPVFQLSSPLDVVSQNEFVDRPGYP
jgi:hypothetical protein